MFDKNQFPSVDTTRGFPNDMPLYRVTSPLAEGPFPISGAEAHAYYFSVADIYAVNGIEIIAENNVSPTIIEELISYEESATSNLYDTDESPVSPYTVKVFVSKDDSYLREAFDKTEPLDNEVCVFLEDNSTDVFSDGTAYVKVGKQFSKDLAKRKAIADAEPDNIPEFTFINENGESDLQINFTEEQLKELIETGEISNTSRTVIIGIFQAINFGTLILTPVYSFLGDGIIWITTKLREYIKFQDYHWDPEAKRPKDYGGFEPILCPFANELLAAEGVIGEAAADAINDGLIKELEKWKGNLSAAWSVYSRFSGTYTVPAGVTDFIEKAEERILYLIDNMVAGIKGMVKVFLYIGENSLNAINAFYCGLWNSLVEVVLGIVDLVGYLFKGLAMAGDAVNNAQTLVPQALEMMDELVQAIMQTNLSELSKAAMDALLTQLSHLNIMTLVNAISIERTAYYLGAFIGFIVEIVAGMLYSGGVASINAVVQKLAKFGKIGSEVLDFIKSATTRTLGASSAFSLEYIMAIVQKIISLLRKGKDEVVKFINDVFAVIQKAAQLTDEIIEEIMRKFNISATDKQLIDELGMVFTNYAGETCSICNKTI